MRSLRRRPFLTALLAMSVLPGGPRAEPSPPATATAEWKSAVAGGMAFRWRHEEAALIGDLEAPTSGWLAVGFNDRAALRGTCFVMAQVSEPPGRMELRRAWVPKHEAIADPAIQASLQREEGVFVHGRSRLRFRLPHTSGDALAVGLRPGTESYLMLAWSHDRAFDHHSAFREHRQVTL